MSRERERAEPGAEGRGEARIDALAGREGVRTLLLVDRSGRVVAERGIPDRGVLTRAASLVAGLHATGARLLEGAGDPGRSDVRIRAGDAELLMVPLPPPSTHVLLIATETGDDALAEALPGLARELAASFPGLPDVTDPRAFEASLTRSREGPPPGGGT